MASNFPGECCITGIRHNGEPRGELVKIEDDVDAYLATPSPDKAIKDVGVLVLSDVYGLWQNNKLLADGFAEQGFLTLMPDVFHGDTMPLVKPPGFSIEGWFAKGSDGNTPHGSTQIDPIVVKAINDLRARGVKKIAAAGYCIGSKYVARHFKSGIEVGYFAHPSFVAEDELSSITGPLSIAAAQTDGIFTTELRHKSEEILARTTLPWQITLYSGVEHGFAARGGVETKEKRVAKDQAFFQAVSWFKAYLLEE